MASARRGRFIEGRWVDWDDLTPSQRAGYAGNGGSAPSTSFLPPKLQARADKAEAEKTLIPRTVKAAALTVGIIWAAWQLKKIAEDGLEGPAPLIAAGGAVAGTVIMTAVSSAVEEL